MKTTAEKTRENTKSRSVANQIPKGKAGGTAAFDFVDHRPEARQLGKLQEMADNGPQAKNAAQLQEMIDASPLMVAQRQQLRRMFGETVQRQGPGSEEDLQMKAAPVRTKLTVGPAGDAYEQEADQVAKQAVGWACSL